MYNNTSKKKEIKYDIIINEIHDYMPNDHNLNSSLLQTQFYK